MKGKDLNRICLFNSSVIWGGGEKWHLETAKKLATRGFEPVIFCDPRGDLFHKSNQSGIKTIPVKIRNLSFLNPFRVISLYLHFRGIGAGTLIAGLTSDLKAAALAARLCGVKSVFYRRGTALPLKNNLLNRILYKHLTDAIIVNSKEIRNILISQNSGLIDERKIYLIYNEVDLTHGKEQIPVNTRAYRSNGEVILGNIGRLVEQKGQKYLIELARYLKERGIGFRILIAGSGKLKNQLTRHAEKAGVKNEVVFMDFIEDINAFLREIDIFVFPSLHEGSSHTLLEVMAASKPVVAFNISSIPEIVEHNRNGFLVETGNSAQLFRSVLHLIEKKELQVSFGQYGREKVEKQFNSDQGINKLIRLIRTEK